MNSNPENIGDSVKSHTEVLTHKAFYASLWIHSMKNETKQRLKAIAIGLLIAAVIVIQGLLESNPNH